MSFFSDELTHDKLTILYFLSVLRLEPTNEQLTAAALSSDWMNYFALQTCLAELEESKLIALVPRMAWQTYALTSAGREALSLFHKRLPLSLREQIAQYAAEHRKELLHQIQYATEVKRLSNGAFCAWLRALELDTPLMEISLILPTRETANEVCANWPSHAEEIYVHILNTLSEKD